MFVLDSSKGLNPFFPEPIVLASLLFVLVHCLAVQTLVLETPVLVHRKKGWKQIPVPGEVA